MHAMSIRDPTSNLDLLDFLLRVPDSQFRRHGQGSSLFRRAFRTRLPNRSWTANERAINPPTWVTGF